MSAQGACVPSSERSLPRFSTPKWETYSKYRLDNGPEFEVCVIKVEHIAYISAIANAGATETQVTVALIRAFVRADGFNLDEAAVLEMPLWLSAHLQKLIVAQISHAQSFKTK